MRRAAAIVFCLLVLPGCVIVQVGVTNPIPGLTTVAVAPFFNLSQEPESVADGRRAAIAYYSELQKTPGFQVIPVGVVEQVIRENQLQLSRPDDALELCRILGCDAVIVGAITDYDPYYPPRLGLQVSWFSPYPFLFEPGIPVDPLARKAMWQAAEDARRDANRRKAAASRSHRKPHCDCKTDECQHTNPVGRDPSPVHPAGLDDPASESTLPTIRGQSDPVAKSTANRPASLWWQPDQEDYEGPPPPQGMRLPRQLSPQRVTMTGAVEPAGGPDFPDPWMGRRPERDRHDTLSESGSNVARLASPEDGHSEWRTEDDETSGDDPEGPLDRAAAELRAARQSRATRVSVETPPPSAPPTPADSPLRPVPPPLDHLGPARPAVPDVSAIGPPIEFDPRRPLMSYTRQFDGSDAALVAVLRDWLELSGDQRSGNWESALHRNEEFLRFCSHQMIVEMLTLHGGDAQRRIVLKWRRYR